MYVSFRNAGRRAELRDRQYDVLAKGALSRAQSLLSAPSERQAQSGQDACSGQTVSAPSGPDIDASWLKMSASWQDIQFSVPFFVSRLPLSSITLKPFAGLVEITEH